MKNKLLLGTALATSLVAVNTASFADAKVTGSVEYTYNSAEDTTTDSKGAIGSETTVKFEGSKDIDLGTLTTSFKLEDAAVEAPAISLQNGDTTVGVGADFAASLSFTNVPQIGDRASTVAKNVGTLLTGTVDGGAKITNAAGIKLAQKISGGTISAFITPDVGVTQSGGTDSGIADQTNSGSGYNLVYSGNFGVDGLSVKAGMNDITGKNGTADGSSTQYGATYNFGQFSAGVNRGNTENVDTAANQDEYTTTTVGVAFAASDSLSIGLQMVETDGDTNGTDLTNKEELQMISVGYSLGGLGLQISYAEVENVGGTTGSDGEAFQIRTVGKF